MPEARFVSSRCFAVIFVAFAAYASPVDLGEGKLCTRRNYSKRSYSATRSGSGSMSDRHVSKT